MLDGADRVAQVQADAAECRDVERADVAGLHPAILDGIERALGHGDRSGLEGAGVDGEVLEHLRRGEVTVPWGKLQGPEHDSLKGAALALLKAGQRLNKTMPVTAK